MSFPLLFSWPPPAIQDPPLPYLPSCPTNAHRSDLASLTIIHSTNSSLSSSHPPSSIISILDRGRHVYLYFAFIHSRAVIVVIPAEQIQLRGVRSSGVLSAANSSRCRTSSSEIIPPALPSPPKPTTLLIEEQEPRIFGPNNSRSPPLVFGTIPQTLSSNSAPVVNFAPA